MARALPFEGNTLEQAHSNVGYVLITAWKIHKQPEHAIGSDF